MHAPGGALVEDRPGVDELLGMLGAEGRAVALQRDRVVLDDQGDDHLEHHESREDFVRDEKGDGDPRAAIARLDGAPARLGLDPCVAHQVVPVLAGGASEEGEQCRWEGAEVGLVGDELSVGEIAEELHREEGVDREDDHVDAEDVHQPGEGDRKHREEHEQAARPPGERMVWHVHVHVACVACACASRGGRAPT